MSDPASTAGQPPIGTTSTTSRLSRSRRGTGVVFVLLGAMQGTLASRIPDLKTHAGLSDGPLGVALLGIPAGSILAVQVTGRWIARTGSSPVTNTGVLLMCAAMIVPAFAPGFVTLLIALTLVGIGLGLTDTAMNSHAVTVERAYGRPIMSSFHGFASLGALLGALVGALAAHLSVPAQVHFPVVAGAAIAIALAVRGTLLPGSADAHVPHESAPAGQGHRAPWTRPLALLAAVALLAWMTEHAVADWSAVYLRDNLGASGGVATYGFVLFALSMVVTRFLADGLTARLGARNVLRWGGTTAGAGLAIGLATHSVAGAAIGFGLVGVGMAGIVPIIFTAAGNQAGVPHGSAVSKVAGVAFTGSLIGPPLIGLTAEATSLTIALLIVAAAGLSIAAIGPVAIRPARGG